MLVFADVAVGQPTKKEDLLIDETLFTRIAAGKKDAFCELYELSKGPVYAFALSLLHKREDAEDAMQDTFLKIRSAAHLYVPQGKPMAWIITITKNICLMKFRQQAHRSEVSTEETYKDYGFEQIENLEDRVVLESALRVLSQEESQIIMLHAVTGLKHREIAELFQLSLSTVLSKYNRGLRKLREELEGKL